MKNSTIKDKALNIIMNSNYQQNGPLYVAGNILNQIEKIDTQKPKLKKYTQYDLCQSFSSSSPDDLQYQVFNEQQLEKPTIFGSQQQMKNEDDMKENYEKQEKLQGSTSHRKYNKPSNRKNHDGKSKTKVQTSKQVILYKTETQPQHNQQIFREKSIKNHHKYTKHHRSKSQEQANFTQQLKVFLQKIPTKTFKSGLQITSDQLEIMKAKMPNLSACSEFFNSLKLFSKQDNRSKRIMEQAPLDEDLKQVTHQYLQTSFDQHMGQKYKGNNILTVSYKLCFKSLIWQLKNFRYFGFLGWTPRSIIKGLKTKLNIIKRRSRDYQDSIQNIFIALRKIQKEYNFHNGQQNLESIEKQVILIENQLQIPIQQFFSNLRKAIPVNKRPVSQKLVKASTTTQKKIKKCKKITKPFKVNAQFKREEIKKERNSLSDQLDHGGANMIDQSQLWVEKMSIANSDKQNQERRKYSQTNQHSKMQRASLPKDKTSYIKNSDDEYKPPLSYRHLFSNNMSSNKSLPSISVKQQES